jgi:hypothetical protein
MMNEFVSFVDLQPQLVTICIAAGFALMYKLWARSGPGNRNGRR